MTQEELLEMRQTRFIEHLGGLALTWPGSDCTLDRATLDDLDPDKARRIHNVMRLVRRTGLTLREIDAFTDARAPGGSFSLQSIAELGRLVRVRRRLGLSFLEALALWAPLDTKRGAAGGASQYEEIFLGMRVPPAEQKPFALHADGRELASPGSLLAPVAATVCGAVGLTLDDLKLLQDDGRVGTTLDLATLSTLARVAFLCRGARLSVRELVALGHLVSANPFSPATEDFLDRVTLLRDVGLSVADVNYLLRHNPVTPTGLAPDVAATTAVLSSIRDGLQRLARELGDAGAGVSTPDDPEKALLTSLLRAILPQSDADALLELLVHFSDVSGVPARQALVDRLAATLDTAHATALAQSISLQLIDDPSIPAGTPPAAHPQITDVAARAQFLLGTVAPYVAAAKRQALVVEKLAAAFSLDTDLTRELLQLASSSASAWIDAFKLTAASFADGKPVTNAPPYTDWWNSHLWLHKVALLIQRLHLTPAEVRAWRLLGTSGWLKLEEIPTTAPATPSVFAQFDALATALEVVRQRAWVQPGQQSLLPYASQVAVLTIGAALGALEAMTGAEHGRLRDVAAALGIVASSSLRDGATLSRLRLVAELVMSSGVAAATLADWAGATLPLAQARAIRGAVKARVAPEEWASVAKPLQDRLREAQRDALLAYICARDHVTPTQATEHLLIDVEMSACQLTSRIRQALNSVQLFVQRVSLGLEFRKAGNTNVALQLDDESALQWREWMRSYATWKAARMLFLYPESYLDLSLRDDKTPFFVELEKDLTQSEINADSIEEAFRNYLTKLDQVALLDVLAVYEERPDLTTSTIHFFARTRGTPNVYFYRTLVDYRQWTPWERLDLDLTGKHLIPFVDIDDWNQSTLYLFWPLFHEKQQELPIPDDNNTRPGTPWHYFEIELAWSERKAGRWTPKRVAQEKIKTLAAKTVAPDHFTFHAAKVDRVRGGLQKYFTGWRFEYRDDLIILCRKIDSAGSQLGWWIFPTCSGDWPVLDVEDSGIPLLPWVTMPFTKHLGMRLVSEGTKHDPIHGWSRPKLPSQLFATSDLEIIEANPEKFTVAHTTAIGSTTADYAYPPWVFQDGHRSYAVLNNVAQPAKAMAINDLADPALVLNGWTPPPSGYDSFSRMGNLAAQQAYHPYACEFLRRLHHGGFDALFKPDSQTLAAGATDFQTRYTPGDALAQPWPQLRVDFSARGAYSVPNWELFFHAPLRVAELLARAGHFEDALIWVNRVFDPRDPDVASNPQKVWRFLPFINRPELQLTELLALLDYQGTPMKQWVGRIASRRSRMRESRTALALAQQSRPACCTKIISYTGTG